MVSAAGRSSICSTISFAVQPVNHSRSCVKPMEGSCHQGFGDQFGFRPTGSTTAALIALIHTVLTMLSSNAYVRVFALDFVFDTVRHAMLIDNMTKLQMPDQVFNWIKDFSDGHTHCMRYTPERPQHSPVYKPVLYKAQV